MHRHSGFLLFAIACGTLLCSSVGTALAPGGYVSEDKLQQRLAVVVPAYQGDLKRAVASLQQWPTSCSPVTKGNVDLVLYYAEGEEDASDVDAAAAAIVNSAGHCFRETLTVYAHLSEEDDVYPKGPSVMFYKMFLDTDVRSKLSEYDALAIIEWDVLVASERSFEELYYATFRVNEEFWVKGSNLEGTNFHSSSTMSDMWHVLGHINGNAIYNNNDPAFVEYVRYTLSRWEYSYPYDVALWLTISDFPYSWPLYQRFSNKFVTTNLASLIAYVGKEHVDHGTVSDAVAGQTLFIHGKNVDEGSRLSAKTADEGSADIDPTSAPEVARKLRQLNANREWNESHESNQLVLESGETWRNLQANAMSGFCCFRDPYTRRLADNGTKDASKVARKLQKWKNEEGQHDERNLQTASKVARKLRRWRAEDQSDGRQLQAAGKDEFIDASAGQLPENDNVHSLAQTDEDDDIARFFKEESERLFVQDVVRGSICAFVTGTSADAERTTVTVESILRFMPGVRVAVAAEDAALDTYKRAFEGLPGVSVSSTQSTITASLYADEYCSTADTALIYYVKPGSVVSRTFTAKDTHSPQGDLLVVYGKDVHLDTDHASGEWAHTVLGFEAPSFTSGTDLILPVGANADLRAAFMSGDNVESALDTLDDLAALGNASTVPQLLAALQYKQATPGIWFFNPQEWVSKHLFQTASIWEIPLVKPRFICEIYSPSTAAGSSVDVLRKHLDFFTMGGTCEGGVISA
ncbi:unnamed protein product [Scytosiphon promiscuus]